MHVLLLGRLFHDANLPKPDYHCTTDGEFTQSSGKLPNDAATHALFKFHGTLSSPLQEQMHAILFVSWQLLSCC